MRLGFLLVFVLSVGLVSGISICIDNVDPSAPFNLSVSGNVGSILLEWDAATDEPSCSGIDEYIISREGDEIGRVLGSVLNFIDNASLGSGEYTYTVYAVDLVGHNTGSAIKNVVSIGGGGGGTSGGSSSLSFVCVEDWSCEEWSGCFGNEQRRFCNDVNECGTNKSKPDIYQSCSESSGDNMTLEADDVESNSASLVTRTFSAITGAVVGVAGTPGGVAVIAFMVLVLSGFIVIRIRRRRVNLSQSAN